MGFNYLECCIKTRFPGAFLSKCFRVKIEYGKNDVTLTHHISLCVVSLQSQINSHVIKDMQLLEYCTIDL